MSFVATGYLEAGQLRQLLEEQARDPHHYFLRWPHAVSGFVQELQEPLSPEGQLITRACELRWKQRRDYFEVLLLSTKTVKPEGFEDVDAGADWQFEERRALPHGNETRYPNQFEPFVGALAQRYFLDARTGTVHFVALTLDY